MAPPKYVLGVPNSFTSESAPSLFQAESMFTSNDDVINVDKLSNLLSVSCEKT